MPENKDDAEDPRNFGTFNDDGGLVPLPTTTQGGWCDHPKADQLSGHMHESKTTRVALLAPSGQPFYVCRYCHCLFTNEVWP